MSDPALSPIYDRLNGTSQYHPFSADTFADWASEAGDTVQITRNNETYTAPVHKQTISWHGAHKVTMESTGTKDREATERTSNRKYRNSSGGLSSDKAAKRKIQYDFYDQNGALHSMISITAQSLITQFQDADAGLQSQITQEAGRISLVVEGTGKNAHIKPASIVAAINAQTGSSSVKISADQIELTGEVIASALSVEDDIACGEIDCRTISVGTKVECQDVEAASVEADIFHFAGDNGSFTDCVCDSNVNKTTGIVTLIYASGRTETFSRATSTVVLTPSWSGSDFTVAANTGQSVTESFWVVKEAGDSSGYPGGLYTINEYDANHKGSARIYSTRVAGGNGVLYKIVADASGVYSAGVSAGEISGAASARAAVTMSSKWTSGNGYTFTAGNSANSRTVSTTITGSVGNWLSNNTCIVTVQATNKPESRLYQWTIDASGIYSDGVAAGEAKFSLASVTLQGTGVAARQAFTDGSTGTAYYQAGNAITVRPVVSSGGTLYYTAGTKVTRYQGGSTFTVQGTRAGAYTWYYQSSSGEAHYRQNGTLIGYFATYGTATLYNAGTTTKMEATNGAEITPITSTSVRLGTSQTLTPINASSAIRVGAQTTLYTRGSTVSDTYYTKTS